MTSGARQLDAASSALPVARRRARLWLGARQSTTRRLPEVVSRDRNARAPGRWRLLLVAASIVAGAAAASAAAASSAGAIGTGTGAPAAAPGAADEPIYVSAGIGDDDPIGVEMMRRLHNVQLVFALQGSGSFVADVRVSFFRADGTRVLAAFSPGPLFFTTLHPGQYRVEAEFHGQRLTRTLGVVDHVRRDVYFYWQRE